MNPVDPDPQHWSLGGLTKLLPPKKPAEAELVIWWRSGMRSHGVEEDGGWRLCAELLKGRRAGLEVPEEEPAPPLTSSLRPPKQNGSSMVRRSKLAA